MSLLMSIVMLVLALLDNRDALFIASGLFAISSSIEYAAYKYSKNKNQD